MPGDGADVAERGNGVETSVAAVPLGLGNEPAGEGGSARELGSTPAAGSEDDVEVVLLSSLPEKKRT